SAMLAAPALAATTTTGPAGSPGTAAPDTATHAPATPPGGTMGTSHTAAGPASAGQPATAANKPAPPKFTTADNQLRAGKLVGASVYNDKNQSVGSINDILLSQDQDKAQTAVISVGGFLGMGSKLVSVPFEKLKIEKDKVIMPGATEQALKQMPAYKFNRA
ncbi:MAG TPA: PRC-barrel domain-containing protein, partial [Acetobacteraceae bacterium]|nr:PRC-barrel domain-containing protein [Acetobacteraceae bacterium]